MQNLDTYFEPFRKGIVGNNQSIETPYGVKPLVYMDWIASGRLYQPIEDAIVGRVGPMVANTHSESSDTGKAMTLAYHHAHELIKQHVHAREDDVIITCGTGMTGALSKLIRMLGLKVPEVAYKQIQIVESEKPVVFITHMEHHSNQLSWLETIADLVVVPPGDDLLVDPGKLDHELGKYASRKLKIGAFTACSNVTGIKTPYHQLAAIMHAHGGICLIDFAASAPYAPIDMHPATPEESLDGICFSPHKFLGGPGSAGVLIFNKKLYHNTIPDEPGGGTVSWTNPWGGRSYFDNIEQREDGGTPGFIQAIRAALCIRLKETMGVGRMQEQETRLNTYFMERLAKIPTIVLLAPEQLDRIGAISFYAQGIHYNLIVKLLNDRFGIQVRGGCSCAGTYGHYLLHVKQDYSNRLTDLIDHGDLSQKPGWVRVSLHPTTTFAELDLTLQAIESIVKSINQWEKDYTYDEHTNEYRHFNEICRKEEIEGFFDLPEVAPEMQGETPANPAEAG